MSFKPDPNLTAPLRECMEAYGVGHPSAEWPNNIISSKAVVYPNGVIAREADAVPVDSDNAEVEHCRRLAAAAKAIFGEQSVGMGSESDDAFFPFFICSGVGSERPAQIDEALIRSRFGGTIFPPSTITVEPLEESGVWWSEVSADAEGDADLLSGWRKLIRWFNECSDLSNPSFVRIGDREELWQAEEGNLPEGTKMTGSVLPRLAVGLTENGSLVGLFGYSVQT